MTSLTRVLDRLQQWAPRIRLLTLFDATLDMMRLLGERLGAHIEGLHLMTFGDMAVGDCMLEDTAHLFPRLRVLALPVRYLTLYDLRAVGLLQRLEFLYLGYAGRTREWYTGDELQQLYKAARCLQVLAAPFLPVGDDEIHGLACVINDVACRHGKLRLLVVDDLVVDDHFQDGEETRFKDSKDMEDEIADCQNCATATQRVSVAELGRYLPDCVPLCKAAVLGVL